MKIYCDRSWNKLECARVSKLKLVEVWFKSTRNNLCEAAKKWNVKWFLDWSWLKKFLQSTELSICWAGLQVYRRTPDSRSTLSILSTNLKRGAKEFLFKKRVISLKSVVDRSTLSTNFKRAAKQFYVRFC